MATTRPSRRRSPRPASDRMTQFRRAIAVRHTKRRLDQIVRHIGLIGKINPAPRPAPMLRSAACATPRRDRRSVPELPEGLTPLCRCFRSDEIGQAFHFSKIEAAILERTARELASLAGRQPSIFLAHQIRPRSPRAAVQLQFSNILAGLAVRGREPQHQRFIDHIAARRIAHTRQASPCAARGGGRSASRAPRRHAARKCAPPQLPAEGGRRRAQRSLSHRHRVSRIAFC